MRSRTLVALVSALLLAVPHSVRAGPVATVGDLLPRIQCPPGYTARIYAQGLHSPDGLAISPAGIITVYRGRYLPIALRPMEESQ